MRNRIDLHNKLTSIATGNKVYYQAPSSLIYPCIIYEKSGYQQTNANNHLYKNMARYTITCIGKNADNDILINKLLELPYCKYDRRFVNDNLYHDVLEIYY